MTSAAIIFWALTLLVACTDASWLADSLTLLTEFPAGSVPLEVFSFGAMTLYWPVWVVSWMAGFFLFTRSNYEAREQAFPSTRKEQERQIDKPCCSSAVNMSVNCIEYYYCGMYSASMQTLNGTLRVSNLGMSWQCLTGVAWAAASASCAATWLLFFFAARLTTPSGRGALAASPGAKAICSLTTAAGASTGAETGAVAFCSFAAAGASTGTERGAVAFAAAGARTAAGAETGAAACRLRLAKAEERHSTSRDSAADSLAAIAGAASCLDCAQSSHSRTWYYSPIVKAAVLFATAVYSGPSLLKCRPVQRHKIY